MTRRRNRRGLSQKDVMEQAERQLAADEMFARGQTERRAPGTKSMSDPYNANFIPDMRSGTEAKPIMDEIGGTGTAIFNGIITGEDYNPDFYWRDGTRIYDTMRRNDAQVVAILLMMELPIRRAAASGKKIVPFDDSPEALEVASFVETAMFHRMRSSFDDLLRQILIMLPHGFSPFEKVWKIENGKVLWEDWSARLPRTVYKWYVGHNNKLEGIQQWTYMDGTYKYVDIPAEKLLVFTHRKEGNNFEGVSVLRGAYKHWFLKDKYYTIEAIGIERTHVPVPIIRLPANYSKNDLTNAQDMGASIRANEALYLTLPDGWDAEWMSSKGRPLRTDVQPAILHQNMMIATAIVASFLSLGESATGAYSLAVPLIELFLLGLQAVVQNIEDTINLEAIPELVDYNFDTDKYPRLSLGEVSIKGIQDLAPALAQLAKSGLIRPTEELEDHLLEISGIPRAPRNLVEATNLVVDPSKDAKALPSLADQGSTGGDASAEAAGTNP